MKHRVALCVGHSRLISNRIEGGAVSVGGVSEHSYNTPLAEMVSAKLEGMGIDSSVISLYEGGGYSSAMRWLGGHLKAKGATVALELHFNSASNRSATGHEWLHWPSSTNGRSLAQSLDRHHRQMFPDFRARGTKSTGGGSRGSEFLRVTHCPAVICEPFFGSNPEDWRHAVEDKGQIAEAMALGIREYLDT